MGRKAVKKARKEDHPKFESWRNKLAPEILRSGFKDLTMDVVAKKLSISKSTIYEYLASKEQIVAMVFEYKLSQLAQFEHHLFDENLNFKDRFTAALTVFSEHASQLSNVFLLELKTTQPQLWDKIKLFIKESLMKLGKFYQDGMEAQAFKKHPVKILLITDQLFFEQVIDPDFLESQKMTLQEVVDSYLKLKFEGLLR
ncbi:MAG: TetR/AcrR family transcriptional regulator [Bacteroidota bacterium]